MLPIPLSTLETLDVKPNGRFKSLSRSVQRRVQQSCHKANVTRDAISALNKMYRHRDNWVADRPATKSQKVALEQLECFTEWLGSPPSDLTRQGALRELLAKTGYSGESQGAVVSIEVDSVALPAAWFST